MTEIPSITKENVYQAKKVPVAILGIRAASASSPRVQSIVQLSVRSSMQVT